LPSHAIGEIKSSPLGWVESRWQSLAKGNKLTPAIVSLGYAIANLTYGIIKGYFTELNIGNFYLPVAHLELTLLPYNVIDKIVNLTPDRELHL
jgi:hypothetical protein